MSDVVVNEGGEALIVEQTAEEVSNAEALARFNESQEKGGDDLSEVPEGFNPDGTPIQPDDNIPEKFKGKSAEDVIKMYQELEKLKDSKKVEEPVAPEVPETPTETPTESTGFTKYTNEYAETGTISEESYKDLEAKGFPRSDVDAYIEGQKALGSNFTASIHEITGGEEGYNDLITWAVDGMDASTITEYNTAIQSGDQSKVKQLIEYMTLKRGSVSPTPNRIDGTGQSDAGGMKAFTDKNDWARATNNHLYGKDEKYTNMIDKRYLASLRKGTI